MNKQQLASKIWESANKMRSKIEANEYKDYILGFMFYKFLSDKEREFLKREGFAEENLPTLDEDNEEVRNYISNNIGYFIGYKNLYNTWLYNRDLNVSDVREGLADFERFIPTNFKKTFSGIFDTLSSGLGKLGENTGAQTKAIRDLLGLIAEIPMNGRQDYDVVGFVYEYLIGMFAANAGKKAGEFYTPHEVSVLMSEIIAHHLKDRETIEIFDPTSGSGSLLLNIGKSAAQYLESPDRIKYYAQELKKNTYNLTRMNLVMRGIPANNIITRNADSLEDDWPYFDEADPNSYQVLYLDAVVSNPPYSQAWDPTDKENDPRFARFGLAPKKKADYAFLLHDLYHLKPEGIMAIVLPHGVLFRGGGEAKIRANLIENNHIDAIIGLPANIFFGTGIPTIVMVLKQKREDTDILIVDASKQFEKVGKNNKLRAQDIKKIADTVIHRRELPKYSRRVCREEIRKNGYNLNIPRYVDSSDREETWDIYASMFGGIPDEELNQLQDYWKALPGLREQLFIREESGYYKPSTEDISSLINESEPVRQFKNQFIKAFSGFNEQLKQELVVSWRSVDINSELNRLSDEVFRRLESIPLINPYDLYQNLYDSWGAISGDLELLQGNKAIGDEVTGLGVANIVDPLYINKKKDGKNVEKQEGWRGRILPFDLVQKHYLKEELESLSKLEERIRVLETEQEELFDSLSEEDKESEAVNEERTGFETKVIPKLIKGIKETEADEFQKTLIRVNEIQSEMKSLVKQIRQQNVNLISHTKEKIESLSEAEILFLLEKKWLSPLIESIEKVPQVYVDQLVTQIDYLAKKYKTTLVSLDAEIDQTEKELASMLDELTGSKADLAGLIELKRILGGNNES